MSWTMLLEQESEYGGAIIAQKSANMLANSVGTSLDSMLTKAENINSSLSSGIGAIKTTWDDALSALHLVYSNALVSPNYAISGLGSSAPDYSSTFNSSIPLSDAPTLVDAPLVTNPNPSFPEPVDMGVIPLVSAAPVYATITSAFAGAPVLPDAPALDAAPTTAALDGSQPAPNAPAVGTVLNAAAYSGAFALARNAALQAEAQEHYEASIEAAAYGVGLPYAAKQGAIRRINQKRAETVSKAALEQATLQATHQREDTRWSYEQRLAYWSTTENHYVQRWQTEQTAKMNLWAQKAALLLDQYAKIAEITTRSFGALNEAEAKRVTTLLAQETFKLEQWTKENGSRLEFWAKPTEAKVQVYSNAVQGETARINSVVAYENLLLDSWSKKVSSAVELYKTTTGATIEKSRVSSQILSERFQAENSRFATTIQNLELGLKEQAEKRSWWSAGEENKIKDAEARAADAREIQKILVDTGEKAVYAYASALAEQMKAWLAAVHYQASADANVTGSVFKVTGV